MVGTAKYMDKYFLDPILGFVLPAGIGDALLVDLSDYLMGHQFEHLGLWLDCFVILKKDCLFVLKPENLRQEMIGILKDLW